MAHSVLIVQELLAQYRVPFYERLRSELGQQGVELALVHGRAAGPRAAHRDEATLPWATPVHNRRISVGGSQEVVWQPALKSASNHDLVIVEHANRQLVNYPLMARAMVTGKPKLAFWGHGRNMQASNTDSMPERFKRTTARLPHWWFAYTAGAAEHLRAIGFPEHRITVVQNAVSVEAYPAEGSISKDPESAVFLGSLHQHKRIDFLLAAAEQISMSRPGFRLRIVGDGPLRSVVEAAAARWEWVTYCGPLFNREKAEVVSRSQLLLMPGLVGLAALDSFSGGTPMVTTAVPFHSPEFEYLQDGVNSRVLGGDSSISDYAAAVMGLLRQPGELERLRAGCLRSAERFTLDAMVSRFHYGILAALDLSSSH